MQKKVHSRNKCNDEHSKVSGRMINNMQDKDVPSNLNAD